MNREFQQATESYGLLAFGSSGSWEVSIDESREREDEWSAEIESPNIYLLFSLPSPSIVPRMLRFLEQPVEGRQLDDGLRKGEDSLTIGKFGQASVALVWDDEDSGRCFLVIGAEAKSTMHLTLQCEDVKRLIEALHQVVDDLPKEFKGLDGVRRRRRMRR
jgi:hypothetical protein